MNEKSRPRELSVQEGRSYRGKDPAGPETSVCLPWLSKWLDSTFQLQGAWVLSLAHGLLFHKPCGTAKNKKPLKTNRKKKKTETQVAKSLCSWERTVTASRHIALHTISDCQSLNTMNSGSVGHCLGKRGLLESTAGDHTYLHSVATNPDDSGNGRQNSKLQINEL